MIFYLFSTLVRKGTSFLLVLFFLFQFFSDGVMAQEVEYYCEEPHTHLEGNKCYCDEGYINHNGKCQDPYAVCRGYNATYSPAIKNCKCADGYVEKNNYCVKIEEEVVETDKNRVGNKENNAESKTEVVEEEVSVQEKKEEVIQENDVVEKKIDSLMDGYYSKHDEKTQKIIQENSVKIKKLEDGGIDPSDDIYGSVIESSDGEATVMDLRIPVKESFDILSGDEKKEAENQFEAIADFAEPSFLNDEEISLDKGKKDILEQVKESVVEESLVRKKDDWRKELEKAERDEKLKEGVTKEQFELEKEMEERLKWQIATIKKSIGFEHMRIIEVTGIVKPDKTHQPIAFERMSGDYREYFDNKSAVSNEGGELAGVVFDKSVKNITGMNKQLKDLKKALREQYPSNWKKKYLDVSDEPTREKQEKEIEEMGLFNFIQNSAKQK